MTSFSRRSVLRLGAATAALAGISRRAVAATSAGPGVTDSEVKLGTTAYYSGPASTAAAYGQAQVAYFQMVNDRGGINGRKVNLISLDNAFSPPKALEQTRKLVESEEVFAIAGSLGTPTNVAIQKYLNGKGVPNLFLTSGAERFNDPKNFPWIVPFYPIYAAQGALFAKHILKERPSAKIAVQFENDDLGRDYVKGLKQGLGEKASSMIVKELSHELSDPTIDAQIVDFKASGADVLIQFTQSKFAAQGIRAAAGMDWHPMHIVASNAGSISTTFIPAGAEASKGVITAIWERNPADPTQAEHPAVKEFKAFAAKYMPNLDLNNAAALPGYNNAYMIEQALRRCGHELSRENLLKQSTTLSGVTPPMFIDGIGVWNSPTDYRAIHHLQLSRFDGTTLASIGQPESIDNLG
ncbi:ABC transporter substrate-binding protein [Bradyrhizobium sp.]|uniref:ABC transporter substrate-binding protein n=1 Tax=Bradyrhizobium sp. TaxID=376 RepID=UPI0039E41235